MEMTETSELFEKKIVLIQNDLLILKRINNDSKKYTSSKQKQHHDLVLTSLSRRISHHIEIFKNSIKIHSENVKSRQQRVVKYGQGHDHLRAGLGNTGQGNDSGGNGYAMFKSLPVKQVNSPVGRVVNNNNNNYSEFEKKQELRRRGSNFSENNNNNSNNNNNNNNNNSSSNNNNNFVSYKHSSPYVSDNTPGIKENTKKRSIFNNLGIGIGGVSQEQLQEDRVNRNNNSKYQNTLKVETAIAQMGSLFTQMSTMVMEQGETLARIEDDVEGGLLDTIEAHESMTVFYEVTKGNRSMIIKIFLLLLFFIFLFIVWT
jgi:hypothetical protein